MEPVPGNLEPWTLALRQYFLEHRAGFDAAVATLRASVATCEEFFTQHDLLLTPTLARLPPRIGWLGPDVPFQGGIGAADELRRIHAGAERKRPKPAMSVPLHWSSSGLPIGSHFAARAGDERTLLELAYQLEEARPWAGRLPSVSAT